MRTLMLASLLLASSVAGAATLTETIDRTFDVRAGSAVTLRNVNGGITVTSWDQPRVRVVAHKEVKADRDEVREALTALRVDIQQRDGALSIVTQHPREGKDGSFLGWLLDGGDRVNAQVRYELTVPRSMNVDISNTNGGIRLTDVHGRLELETTNGGIEVERCSGAIEASTTNGRIEAELLKVAKGQPLRFDTTNGRIEVTLPPDLSVDVDASTTNGSIRSDLPVATHGASKNSLRGTINGGGGELRLRTTNGGIQIRTLGRS